MVNQGLNVNTIDSRDTARFIEHAIRLAVENVELGGGPFGALVVKDGKIIGEGANHVTSEFDPTAHAEIVAIRAACKHEKEFHLSGCVLYTSCEPCPMCLAAAYWAHIPTIYYAAAAGSAAAAGFADAFMYDQFRLPSAERDIALIQIPHADSEQAFQNWNRNTQRVDY